jgi:hypothetical protein
MPKISLVVCLYREKDLLERLLKHAEGCYDDLVVVHDGKEIGEPSWRPSPAIRELAIDWANVPAKSLLPDFFAKGQTPISPGSIRELVEKHKGRFFEHPRVGSLEGQSPFSWWAAKYDWILRLDADEFPSKIMADWLKSFRTLSPESVHEAGFSCIWPLWDGVKMTTHRWPRGRLFLFDRTRARFFGLVEQVPIIEGPRTALPLILHHQPRRKSYGIRNVVFRPQAYIWRKVIATSLNHSPLNLPRWRFSSSEWPSPWREKLHHPFRCVLTDLFWYTGWQALSMLRWERRLDLSACLTSALIHFLLQIEIIRQKYRSS